MDFAQASVRAGRRDDSVHGCSQRSADAAIRRHPHQRSPCRPLGRSCALPGSAGRASRHARFRRRRCRDLDSHAQRVPLDRDDHRVVDSVARSRLGHRKRRGAVSRRAEHWRRANGRNPGRGIGADDRPAGGAGSVESAHACSRAAAADACSRAIAYAFSCAVTRAFSGAVTHACSRAIAHACARAVTRAVTRAFSRAVTRALASSASANLCARARSSQC